MILTRTPCRLSFLGGGTDLPAFFQDSGEEGAVLSVTINQFIHVSAKLTPDRLHRMRHENLEMARAIEHFTNPIVRTILTRYDEHRKSLDAGFSWDVTSISDVPAGTGLGSSSTFTVGLISAVRSQLGLSVDPVSLAKEAIEIELDVLRTAAGLQDQYCAALGGFLFLRFSSSGDVSVERLGLSAEKLRSLGDCTALFYTGITRAGRVILEQRRDLTAAKRTELRLLREMAFELKSLLSSGSSMQEIGKLMHEGWLLKRGLAQDISSTRFDDWYAQALKAGAWGGKLMGAGGGGYFLFFCPPEARQRLIAALGGLTYVPFEFEFSGCQALTV